MFRHSLLLSLLIPLICLLVLLMLAVSFDGWMKQKMPELRGLSAGLIGVVSAWFVVSFYLQIRRRVLNPLRELKLKLQRARYDRLETVAPSPIKDEISDVLAGYNQMVAALSAEREEKTRLEQERVLQSQLAALGLQADGLVHELASPLSALSTLGKLAADGDRESAKTLAAESRALAERLRRFMAFFRERKVTVRPVALVRLIEERLRLIPQDRVRFELLPAEEMSVLSDEVLLAEILDNLLKNAQRHASSKVAVEAGVANGEACVIVTDDGGGIPPKHAEKLFRPFFTTADGGHGLGLFVSKLWAHALGGQLTLAASSHPTLGGASFRVGLPLMRG